MIARTLVLPLIAATLCSGGCASQCAPVSMGDLGPEQHPPIITLGAGDTLGRDIYVNDLIIAAGRTPITGEKLTDADVNTLIDELGSQ